MWTGATYDVNAWLSVGFAVAWQSVWEDGGGANEGVFIGGTPLPLVRLFGMVALHGGMYLWRGDVGGFAGLGLRYVLP